MRRTIFSIALMLFVVMFFCLPAGADKTTEITSLLKSRIKEVLSVLSIADLTDEEKKERIRSIVSPLIDFDLMSRLTLGRQNWDLLTEDQQKRFVDRFVERLKTSYLDKTTIYSEQGVVYEKAVVDKDKVFVPTRIITDDTPLSVVYKFYRSKTAWKVYDIEIEGVSFIRSYRTQFNEILRNGTVDDLLKSLEEPPEEDELP